MSLLKRLFEAPFRGLAVLVHIYASNRRWIAAHTAGAGFRSLIKGLVVMTMVSWVLIWLAAGADQRARLTEAMKHIWAASPQDHLVEGRQKPFTGSK